MGRGSLSSGVAQSGLLNGTGLLFYGVDGRRTGCFEIAAFSTCLGKHCLEAATFAEDTCSCVRLRLIRRIVDMFCNWK